MGYSYSVPRPDVPPRPKRTDQMMALLQNKCDEFLARIQAKRGHASHFEVQGGRSVMRQSEIRVKHGDMNAERALECAILDFFFAVGGGSVKQQAVTGAIKLLKSGLDSVFACKEGQGVEKQAFIVCFINYAFVRIDYAVYTFCHSGGSWRDPDSEAGACYVADLAVLDPAELTASEMDFFLTQALCAVPAPGPALRDRSSAAGDADGGDGGGGAVSVSGTRVQRDIELISRMKILLVQSALLSKMMQRAGITFKEVNEVTEAMRVSMDQVKSIYDQLENHPENAKLAEIHGVSPAPAAGAR